MVTNHLPTDKVLVDAFGTASRITAKDMQTLDSGGLVNDAAINCYLSIQQAVNDAGHDVPRHPAAAFKAACCFARKGLCHDTAQAIRSFGERWHCYIFNTYFFPMLELNGYESVRRWTRKAC